MIRPFTAIALRNSGRRPGWPRIVRQPSSSSAACRRCGSRAGRSSLPPIARIASAESRWLTASTTSVTTGPNSPIAAPPSGGPSAVALHVVASNRPFATSSCSRRTIVFRYAPLAALKAIFEAATTTATTSKWTNVSQPSA